MGKSITTGEGGMIITNDADLHARASEFSDHGHMHVPGVPRGKDPRRMRGLNYRMNEVTGAIGIAQLAKLDSMLCRQRENIQKVKRGMSDLPDVAFRAYADEKGATADTLIFRMPDEDQATRITAFLSEKGIGTKILPDAIEWHYAGYWTHIFEAFEGYDVGSLPSHWPGTREMLKSSIALPISVDMGADQTEQLTEAIRQAVCSIR